MIIYEHNEPAMRNSLRDVIFYVLAYMVDVVVFKAFCIVGIEIKKGIVLTSPLDSLKSSGAALYYTVLVKAVFFNSTVGFSQKSSTIPNVSLTVL